MLEPSGNLHPANDTGACLASQNGKGPGVVPYQCNPGSNEVWALNAANGTLCSAIGDRFPVRCLAKRTAPPSAPTPAPGPHVLWQVYAKPQPNNSMAVLLLNADSEPGTPSVDLAALGFEGGQVHVRDIWARAPAADVSGPALSVQLDAYDSALLLLSPATPKDAAGAHPYVKIDGKRSAEINATQYAAFTRASCSYHGW